MAKKLKNPKALTRSECARVIRSIQDLDHILIRLEDSVDASKVKLPNNHTNGEKIVDTKRKVVLMRRELVSIAEKLGECGVTLSNYMGVDLSEQEKIEIIGLLYCGINGKKLYTKKQIAKQYGVSVATITGIEYDVPI